MNIFQEILKETIIPFQTSSYFFRTKYVKEYLTDLYKIVPLTEVGDVPLTWYMFYKGDCFFIKDSMSYYRYNCSGSWNARNKNVDKKINLYNELIAFFKIFDSYSKKINNNTIQYLVKKYNFIILQLEKNYKEMISKDYKMILYENKFKFIFKIYVFALFPFAEKIFNLLKRNKLK